MAMTEPPRKTAFVKSYGCQMNVYDSTRMQELLTAQGYGHGRQRRNRRTSWFSTPATSARKPSDKVYSELGKVRVMKEERTAQGNDMLIAVAGCVAQAEGAEIIKAAKGR